MMWMRMPGEGWLQAGASFTGMWVAMMIAMMMPSVAPELWRYRRALQSFGESGADTRTAFTAAGYITVWLLAGVAIFPLGAAVAAVQMHFPATAGALPMVTGAVLALAGAVQLSAWKTRHLACCRRLLRCGCSLPAGPKASWRRGLRYGLHCCQCCAPLMAILLVLGVMNLLAMAIVTAAITAERLAPGGARVAQLIGLVAVAMGVLLVARGVLLA